MNRKIISAKPCRGRYSPWIGYVPNPDQSEWIVKLAQRLPSSHPLSNANYPENMRMLLFVQALASMFGIDEGNDEKRYAIVERTIIPKLQASPKLLEEVESYLPLYTNHAGSGAHRYMPLWLVVSNILAGRPIFDRAPLASLPQDSDTAKYFRTEYPLSMVPPGIPGS
ncbi:MAG: hypothetical protein WC838_03675, partial [Candidatus Margulisiibacteriota bacterium]